jgi:hypothetical protein
MGTRESEARGGIKGGGSTCFSLFDLHQARLSLDAAYRGFENSITVDAALSAPRQGTLLKGQASEPRGCACSRLTCIQPREADGGTRSFPCTLPR